MAEVEYSTTAKLPVETIWDFVREIDNWAAYLTGYQSHQKENADDSVWVLKGDVGAMTRTLKFRVHVSEWAGPERVTFQLEGLNEQLSGDGEFMMQSYEAEIVETASAPARKGWLQRAVEAVKAAEPDLCVATDVCMCEYTDHGHCGIIEAGDVANDPSVERLAATALSHARAGADIVAPSDMMDGRVGAIRTTLDGAGFGGVAILAYAAKFASAYYGPFRDAAESTPAFGDRRSYQMDPSNRREAMREMRADLEEGADALMVKPALPYLDLLADAQREFDVPLAAYHVSGEYAMIKAAAERGWIDGERAMDEALVSIKRAGADWILTYAALDVAARLAP